MRKSGHLSPRMLVFIAVALAGLLVIPCKPVSHSAPEYWPTDEWPTSLPEEQGVDSEKLAEMLEVIHERGEAIRSVVVIRNGYLITEAYFHPFREGTWHVIHSCTKSIVSALIGIALEDGLIGSVDESILSFFPDKRLKSLDADKRLITLEHLLTMSSGLRTQDSYLYSWRGLREMSESADWVQYVLDLPMDERPGRRFDYSNCSSYLLAAILQERTGVKALEFAREHLFDELGITEVDWPESPEGVNIGWGQIRMKPLDLAKIGLLYLNGGEWNGTQIVPTSWVEASTSKQVRAGTLRPYYGYQWWVDSTSRYAMLGYGGQYVIVDEAKNMVVVFASALHSNDFFLPWAFFERYILPAAVSREALAPNPDGVARLRFITHSIANPEASLVPELPEAAHLISGKTYLFEPNTLEAHDVSFTFESGREVAEMTLAYRSQRIEAAIGLDNIPRLGEVEGFLRSYKGYWESEDTFVVESGIIDYTERGASRWVFSGDELTVYLDSAISGSSHELHGRVGEPD